jgi:phosphoglycolate phosphatase-like HAD superfamily hydrolase
VLAREVGILLLRGSGLRPAVGQRLVLVVPVLAHVPPIPAPAPSIQDLLAERFAEHRERVAERGRVLPGARDALRALADRDDVIQSVLTGNMEPIARCKLQAFGLDGFVDFEVGAFGTDGLERPPLVRLARKRAEQKYGTVFDPATTVLIGDTPYDVRAGHEGGARVVAVATGASPEAALRQAGAELVIPDLTGTEAVVRAILNISG